MNRILCQNFIEKTDATEACVMEFSPDLNSMCPLCPHPNSPLTTTSLCGRRQSFRRQISTNSFLAIGKMVFIRPQSIQLPTTWRKFSVNRGGTTINLRIQDMTEDQVEPAMNLLSTYFTAHEPPCRCVGIKNHATALAELQKLWRNTIRDQLSVVCVEDNHSRSEIIGVNVLTVACKEDKGETFKVIDSASTDDKIWAKLFGAVDTVANGVDIFERYGVDKYLTAYGLVVDPAWRGLSIGKEILLARIPLCQALEIKVTATVFTAIASQTVAKKAGFEDIFEMSYEELARRGYVFPGVEEDTISSKLMALVIE